MNDASPASNPLLGAYAGWQKALLVVAIALSVLGGAVSLWASSTRPEPVATSGNSGSSSSALALGLAPSGGGAGDEELAEPDARAVDAWGPFAFRMGFSFFVGFAIAYALRAFLKISLAAAGFFLLLLFGLQYAGIIEVRWDRMAEWWENAGPWMRSQTESFRAFALGQLPSGAAAASGLLIGFRRR